MRLYVLEALVLVVNPSWKLCGNRQNIQVEGWKGGRKWDGIQASAENVVAIKCIQVSLNIDLIGTKETAIGFANLISVSIFTFCLEQLCSTQINFENNTKAMDLVSR